MGVDIFDLIVFFDDDYDLVLILIEFVFVLSVKDIEVVFEVMRIKWSSWF